MLTASSLKTRYSKYCQKMSDTGQGLLDAGSEDGFVEDSGIKNVWGMVFCSFGVLFTMNSPFTDAIVKPFLWYMCMHHLMGQAL